MEYELIYYAARDAGMDAIPILVILFVVLLVSSTGILGLVMRKLFDRSEARNIERQEQLQAQLSEDKVERQIIMGLAHNEISKLAKMYIKIGSITIEEFENLHKYLYTPYKALEGNGKIDKLMRAVDELDFRKCEYFGNSQKEEEKNHELET